jgi:hypothetical protein
MKFILPRHDGVSVYTVPPKKHFFGPRKLKIFRGRDKKKSNHLLIFFRGTNIAFVTKPSNILERIQKNLEILFKSFWRGANANKLFLDAISSTSKTEVSLLQIRQFEFLKVVKVSNVPSLGFAIRFRKAFQFQKVEFLS